MKQGSLDFDEKVFTIKFSAKDIFFNNGIVNLYQFLKNKSFDIEINFDDNGLELKMDSQKSEEIYFEVLRNGLLNELKVVHQTDNKRWFFDEKFQIFKMDNRFDTKGGHKNDARNGILKYIEPTISNNELFNRLESFGEQYIFDIFKKNKKISYEPIFKKDGSPFKKKISLIKHITTEEAIDNFYDYILDENLISINSKIHTFEDGQVSFQDMLKQPKNYKIDKWHALIYWFGGRVQRFYNYSYFIYPNSSSIKALYKFKEFLQINDDKTQVRDEKTGKIKEIGTNIDFFKPLSKDGIVNKNFYISKSEEEFEVKFFMYLFSTIYHIEEQYEKANDRRKARKRELYDALMQITFVVYTDDGTFKTSFNEYTKAYKLIEFFELIKEKDLFKYLADLIYNISIAKKKKQVEPKEVYNQYIQMFSQKLLNFQSFRAISYLVSFEILKTSEDKKKNGFYNRLGKELYKFEQFYLQNILGGKDMSIHEKSKKLGDGIGHFCAELGDKDLLFKLRSVKNYKQMISYFKDLKFATLKNEKEAKFSKEFNESLDAVLDDIESTWEIVRDYIAIYAIDKYKAVSFAKTKSHKGDK